MERPVIFAASDVSGHDSVVSSLSASTLSEPRTLTNQSTHNAPPADDAEEQPLCLGPEAPLPKILTACTCNCNPDRVRQVVCNSLQELQAVVKALPKDGSITADISLNGAALAGTLRNQVLSIRNGRSVRLHNGTIRLQGGQRIELSGAATASFEDVTVERLGALPTPAASASGGLMSRLRGSSKPDSKPATGTAGLPPVISIIDPMSQLWAKRCNIRSDHNCKPSSAAPSLQAVAPADTARGRTSGESASSGAAATSCSAPDQTHQAPGTSLLHIEKGAAVVMSGCSLIHTSAPAPPPPTHQQASSHSSCSSGRTQQVTCAEVKGSLRLIDCEVGRAHVGVDVASGGQAFLESTRVMECTLVGFRARSWLALSERDPAQPPPAVAVATGSTISGCGVGALVAGIGSSLRLNSSEVQGSAAEGVCVEFGASLAAAGCTLTGNKGHNLLVRKHRCAKTPLRYPTEARLCKCTLVNSLNSGVVVRGADTRIVAWGTSLSYNSHHGLELHDDARGELRTGCSASRNGDHGVLLQGRGTSLSARECTLELNREGSLHAMAGTSAKLSGCALLSARARAAGEGARLLAHNCSFAFGAQGGGSALDGGAGGRLVAGMGFLGLGSAAGAGELLQASEGAVMELDACKVDGGHTTVWRASCVLRGCTFTEPPEHEHLAGMLNVGGRGSAVQAQDCSFLSARGSAVFVQGEGPMPEPGGAANGAGAGGGVSGGGGGVSGGGGGVSGGGGVAASSVSVQLMGGCSVSGCTTAPGIQIKGRGCSVACSGVLFRDNREGIFATELGNELLLTGCKHQVRRGDPASKFAGTMSLGGSLGKAGGSGDRGGGGSSGGGGSGNAGSGASVTGGAKEGDSNGVSAILRRRSSCGASATGASAGAASSDGTDVVMSVGQALGGNGGNGVRRVLYGDVLTAGAALVRQGSSVREDAGAPSGTQRSSSLSSTLAHVACTSLRFLRLPGCPLAAAAAAGNGSAGGPGTGGSGGEWEELDPVEVRIGGELPRPSEDGEDDA